MSITMVFGSLIAGKAIVSREAKRSNCRVCGSVVRCWT
jgi:hypothetical protein